MNLISQLDDDKNFVRIGSTALGYSDTKDVDYVVFEPNIQLIDDLKSIPIFSIDKYFNIPLGNTGLIRITDDVIGCKVDIIVCDTRNHFEKLVETMKEVISIKEHSPYMADYLHNKAHRITLYEHILKMKLNGN